MLSVRAVTKRFGGLLAVDRASLEVRAGEIVALIGPNGAGKTTLFELISGFQRPDAGDIVFLGTSIIGRRPHELARMGLVRTFQIVRPFAGLTVRENIAAAAHTRLRTRRAALARAEEVAAALGMESMLDQMAGALPIAGRKRLEVARALATAPKLLLLDEVLAGLNPVEVGEFAPMIRRLCDEEGITILMIEHVMQAVMTLSDRAYVLNEGRVIAEGVPVEVVSNKVVIEAYLGAGTAERLASRGAPDG